MNNRKEEFLYRCKSCRHYFIEQVPVICEAIIINPRPYVACPVCNEEVKYEILYAPGDDGNDCTQAI